LTPKRVAGGVNERYGDFSPAYHFFEHETSHCGLQMPADVLHN
jgi:hypothetical protein